MCSLSVRVSGLPDSAQKCQTVPGNVAKTEQKDKDLTPERRAAFQRLFGILLSARGGLPLVAGRGGLSIDCAPCARLAHVASRWDSGSSRDHGLGAADSRAGMSSGLPAKSCRGVHWGE